MNESMTETLPDTGDDLYAGQPVRVVERDGVRYTLLGTAHVSRASVEAVERPSTAAASMRWPSSWTRSACRR